MRVYKKSFFKKIPKFNNYSKQENKITPLEFRNLLGHLRFVHSYSPHKKFKKPIKNLLKAHLSGGDSDPI